MMRLILTLSVLLMCGFAPSAWAKDPFVNTKWDVSVTPDGDAMAAGEKIFDDVFTFKGSKLTSDKFKAKGFDAADVDQDSRGVSAQGFTVNAKSDKNGTLKITGTTAGDSITGDIVWTKADGTVVNYTFKGEQKT